MPYVIVNASKGIFEKHLKNQQLLPFLLTHEEKEY